MLERERKNDGCQAYGMSMAGLIAILVIPSQTDASRGQGQNEERETCTDSPFFFPRTPLHIIQYDKNPRGRTIEIAAKYEGLDLEIVATDPFDPVKAVEYKKKFPMGLVRCSLNLITTWTKADPTTVHNQVPALEKEDFKLTEVIAISTVSPFLARSTIVFDADLTPRYSSQYSELPVGPIAIIGGVYRN